MKHVLLAMTLMLFGCGLGSNTIESAHDTCEEVGWAEGFSESERKREVDGETEEAPFQYIGILQSDGKSVKVPGLPRSLDRDMDSMLTTLCLLDEVDAPSSVLARMENTRGLDGTQEASHGDLNYFWSYHPDNGLNVLIELDEQ